MTATSIASVFVNDSKNLITAYRHQFRKGTVVCLCVFGDDIIATDSSAQYFVTLGLDHRQGSAPTPSHVSTSSTGLRVAFHLIDLAFDDFYHLDDTWTPSHSAPPDASPNCATKCIPVYGAGWHRGCSLGAGYETGVQVVVEVVEIFEGEVDEVEATR